MSNVSMEVPQGEGGVLRLFELDTGADDAMTLNDALRDETEDAGTLAGRALGTEALDAWWLTLVQPRDLREMGLAHYLSEGHDVPKNQLEAASATLNQASGTVLIVQSPAFGGRAEQLSPAAFLTPLAQFDTTRDPDPARPMKPAEPGILERAAEPPAEPPQKRAALRPIMILAILAAAAVIVALVGLGGR